MKLSPASRRAFSLWGHARGKRMRWAPAPDVMAKREHALQLDAPAHPVLRLMRKGRGCPGHRREAKLRRLVPGMTRMLWRALSAPLAARQIREQLVAARYS